MGKINEISMQNQFSENSIFIFFNTQHKNEYPTIETWKFLPNIHITIITRHENILKYFGSFVLFIVILIVNYKTIRQHQRTYLYITKTSN